MTKRHELTDEQWEIIRPLLPRPRQKGPGKPGRPVRDQRIIANALFWILLTGAPWRDLPERFGPWRTAYHHFNRWRSTGVFDRIIKALQIRLDRDGYIDWDLWCVDGTNVRASRAAGGASKKASVAGRKSQGTTAWAAREAVSGARSTWLLTAKAHPSASRSPRARSRNRPASARSSKAR